MDTRLRFSFFLDVSKQSYDLWHAAHLCSFQVPVSTGIDYRYDQVDYKVEPDLTLSRVQDTHAM